MAEFILISEKKLLGISPNYKLIDHTAYELSKKIKNDIKGEVLIINLEAKSKEDNYRQNHKALDILFFLRCQHKLSNPIIYLGFEDQSTILNRLPESLILYSSATRYVRLPVNLQVIQKLISIIQQENAFNFLWKYLRISQSIEKLRHQEANLWGLYKILSTHNLYLQATGKPSIDISTFISKATRKKLTTKESIIAQFLYHRNSDSQEVFKMEPASPHKVMALDPLPKILYIDDMADIGWAKALKEIFFGNITSNNLKAITPDKNYNQETLWNKVFTSIISFQPDCILLDLRLQNEEGLIFNIDDLSGARLLKKIKSIFPSLPVIIFTASNKANSLTKLLYLGCDFLWTKEGVDEIFDAKTSLNNYFQLLQFIYEASTKFKDKIDKKLYAAEIKLSRLKNKSTKTINSNFLNSYDVILTDTNIWLNENIEKVHQALYILMKNCQSYGSPQFIVIDQVFDEIIRISKEKIDSDFIYRNGKIVKAKHRFSLRKIARWVEPVIQEYYDNNLVLKGLQNTALDPSAKRESFNKHAYADGYFLSKIIPLYTNAGLRILFISNDVKCKKEIRHRIKLDYLEKYNDITSEELIKILLTTEQ